MGNYALSQWADYMRVISPRRKERHRKIGFEKQLISLYRKNYELGRRFREIQLVPLESPYQKGWVRSFVLRDDVARSAKAPFFEKLLEKINTEDYCGWKSFKVVIHRPLSDLFIVYNEQQLTSTPVPVNSGRGLIAKYTHMLAF